MLSLRLASHSPSSLDPIVLSFQKNLFRGTQAALEIIGKHGRPNVKVESDPAAITSLSAACRCASHPPSNPIVTPSELEPGQQ